jgi:hypothetical protein
MLAVGSKTTGGSVRSGSIPSRFQGTATVRTCSGLHPSMGSEQPAPPWAGLLLDRTCPLPSGSCSASEGNGQLRTEAWGWACAKNAKPFVKRANGIPSRTLLWCHGESPNRAQHAAGLNRADPKCVVWRAPSGRCRIDGWRIPNSSRCLLDRGLLIDGHPKPGCTHQTRNDRALVLCHT